MQNPIKEDSVLLVYQETDIINKSLNKNDRVRLPITDSSSACKLNKKRLMSIVD